MHVAIVGAGALGRVYGVRLALLGQVDVSFVVRPEKAKDASPFLLERVDERDDVLSLDRPTRVTEVPAHADVVLVCVRGEQLDEAAELLLRGPDVPAVMLTPMMPGDYERMREKLGARVVPAMPGGVAYVRLEDGASPKSPERGGQREVVRYWLPRVAPTLLEEQRPPNETLAELERVLNRCGLHAKSELGVHESNPATTVTFVPLMMALDVAGGVDALLDDHALLELALRAAGEGHELAQRIGKSAAWVSLLTKFLSRTTLKIGVGIAKHQSPEAVFYVEEHFGRKLHAQNVAMADAIVKLAAERETPHEALAELAQRLRARDQRGSPLREERARVARDRG